MKRNNWFDENESHGAFALTKEEIDFYYNMYCARLFVPLSAKLDLE